MENIAYPDNVMIYGVEVRPYLTMAESEEIAKEMVETDNYFARRAIFDANILKYCVVNQADIEGKDYEMMRACGFIDELHRVIDSYEVTEAVYYIESQTKAINGFINKLTDFVIKLTERFPSKKQITDFISAAQKKVDEK